MGGSSGGGTTFVQRPDTLRSTDVFEGLLGLGAGPWKGPVNGLKSILLNGTAIEGADGVLNFPGFIATFTNGDPALYPQKVDLKLGSAGAPTSVALSLTNTSATLPGPWVVKSVSNLNADFLDLRFIVQQLFHQDASGIKELSANLEIELKPAGATTWVNPQVMTSSLSYAPMVDAGYGVGYLLPAEYYTSGVYSNQTANPYFNINGKTTQAYVYEIRLLVPNAGAYAARGWDVRVRLREQDTYSADPVQERRDIQWESISAGYHTTFGDTEPWRGLAYFQLYGQASNQLNGVPQVTGEYDTLIVPVPPPAVFDPATRAYTAALWDGTWVQAFTTDPAWCINGILQDTLHGIASVAPYARLNKWDALAASKYFSQLVTDGNGGFEPRYSLNMATNDSTQAKEFVQNLAGAVGAIAWEENNGEWRLRVDKAENPVDIFTLESITGEFRYSHTDIETRYNDITAVFLNKEFGYREDRIRIVDSAAIAKFGRKPTTIVLVGCTGRQEAMRRTIIRLRVANNETKTVNFSTNRRGRLLEPLNTILVADADLNRRTDVNMPDSTGRVIAVGAAGAYVDLRDPMRLELGVAYTLNFTTPNTAYDPSTTTDKTATEWLKPTLTQSIAVTNTSGQRGDVSRIYLASAFPVTAAPNANVALSATGLPALPKSYRILDIQYGDGDDVGITAIEIDSGKWAASDAGIAESASVIGVLTGKIPPPLLPTSGMFQVDTFISLTETKRVLAVNWDRPSFAYVDSYHVKYQHNGGSLKDLGRIVDSYYELADPTPGDYTFSITTRDINGKESLPLTARVTLDENLSIAPGRLFFRTTAPSAADSAIGDTWIDDAGVFYDWMGSSWTRSAVQPLEAAIATANGKITVFKAAAIPVSEGVGDLWFKSDTSKWYIAESAGADAILAGEWVLTQDAGIGQAISDAAGAQGTADGKVTTFYQTTAPTPEGIGDLWVDTDAVPVTLSRWNGTIWQDVSTIGATTAQITAITTAQSAADAAQATADAAVADADAANADLANIASDSLLTPDEKPRVIRDRDAIIAEQAGIDAQATAYGITTEKATYDNAVSALTTYLATLTAPVLWSTLTGNTTIVGATFRTKFLNVYAARQALLNKIVGLAKALADSKVMLDLVQDKAGFTYINGALSPTPQTITFTGKEDGVAALGAWSTSPNIKSAASASTFTINNTEMAANLSVTVTFTRGGKTVSKTITKLADPVATENPVYNQPTAPAYGLNHLWYDSSAYNFKFGGGGIWQAAADITAQKTAAAIAGQGALATKSTVTYGTADVAGFAGLAARARIALGDGYVFKQDGITGLTDALAVTSLGTAAAIAGQGPGATAASFDVLNYGAQGGVARVASPGGGSYYYGSVATGRLRIVLPITAGYSMVKFVVDIYNYALNQSCSYLVAGYIYNGAGELQWLNYSAQYLGPENRSLRVTFGYWGGKPTVTIGFDGTSWTYPGVTVRDFQASHDASADPLLWKSGWSVTIAAGELTSPVFVAKPRAGDAVFGEGIVEVGSGAVATLPNFKTSSGTAAAIAGQTSWATYAPPTTRLTYLDDSGNLSGFQRITDRRLTLIRRADGLTDLTEAAAITSLGTAAAIAGQTAWATLSVDPVMSSQWNAIGASEAKYSRTGTGFKKTGATGWTDSAFVTRDWFERGARASMTIMDPASQRTMVGLTTDSALTAINTYTVGDYMIYAGAGSGSFYKYENGAGAMISADIPAVGDTLEVRYSGTTVGYFKNGTLLSTTTVAAGLKLRGLFTTYNSGGICSNVVATTYADGEKLDGIEAAADVTSMITGQATTIISCDYAGTPKAGQVNPRYVQFLLARNGVDVTESATWSMTISGAGTATVSNTAGSKGKVNITAAPSDFSVILTAVYNGTTRTFVHRVQLSLDALPQSGSSGGTSASNSISGTFASATMVALGPELIVDTGTAGQVALSANFSYSDIGFGFARWYAWNGSAYVAVGTEVSGSEGYFDAYEKTWVYGSGNCNLTLTGQGVSTSGKKYKLYMRGDDTTSHPTSGSCSAIGS